MPENIQPPAPSEKHDTTPLAPTLLPGRSDTEPLAPASDADPTQRLGRAAAPTRGFPTIPGYEILEEIGRGGMGVVYKARQKQLNRLVALKMILAGGHASDEELTRFKAEAEAIAQLQHPGIVQIFEVGEHDGLPFFSLEYVDGGSLDKRLKAGRPDFQNAARLAEQLARAVQYAHVHGVVHRDLKPANVLLTGTPGAPLEECAPRIVDFGLAKKLNDTSGVTRSGEVMGTPSYMAPEQAAGKVADIGPLVDVYALGAILYEMLTGQPPHRGATLAETLQSVLSGESLSPGRLRAGLPRDLETVCAKCLERNPARRYGSAGELADDLARFLAGEPVRARRVGRMERAWRWAKRRPSTVLGSLLVIVCLLAGAGGWWLWQRGHSNTIKDETGDVEFYTRVLHPEGEPVLQGRLSADEARTTPHVYRVTRRNARVERVEVMGGPGRLLRHNPYHLLAGIEPRDAPLFEAVYEYERDAAGTLQRVKASTASTEPLWTVSLDETGRDRYAEKGSGTTATFQVTEEGDERVLWFLGDKGERQRSPAKAHGIRVRPWDDGLRLAFLDAQGEPASGRPSACEIEADGDTLREKWFDPKGQPVGGPEGFAVRVLRPEADGGLRMAGLDAAGKEIDGPGGFHAWIARLDGSGREVERLWLRADGKPALVDQKPEKEGLSFGSKGVKLKSLQAARLTRKRDDDGKLLETSYWYAKAGGFVLRLRVDANGWVVEEVELSPAGEPVVDKDGDHRVIHQYDARGNETAASYFGVDGQSVLNRYRYHSSASRFDDKDQLTETSYFGVDGKPCLVENGYHRLTARHDDRGNTTETSYFGVDGKECLTTEGFHRWARKYDARGNVIEHDFFGVDGKPILIKYGYARRTHKYEEANKQIETGYWVFDDRGNIVLERREDAAERILEKALFRPDGKPRYDEYGIHRWVNEYDGRGRRVGLSALTPDGKPALFKAGYHRWAYKLDDAGNPIETTYFGLDDKPCVNESGYHRVETKYDARGKQTESSYFGVDGKPSLHIDGNHRLTLGYDDKGNEVDRSFWGPDGKPVVIKAGYARLSQKYKDGKVIEKTFWVINDSGQVVLEHREDDAKRILEQALFTAQGKPRFDDNGVHHWAYEYDERGRRVSYAVFAPDGKPVLHRLGYHRWRNKLNDGGWSIETKYFGIDDKPCLHADGYHRATATVDQRGKQTEVAFFDINDKPCLFKDGNHRWTAKYDERGNEIERDFFGLDGKPVIIKAGHARVTQKYDSSSRLVEKEFWTIDNKGALVLLRREDPDKRILEQVLYTTDGKPRYDENGVHRFTNEYDERGRRIAIAAFDSSGKPALFKQGFHRWASKLDDRGRVVEKSHFGLDGKPCLHEDGYHRITTNYDERGKPAETAYFGLDGKPCLQKDNLHRWTQKFDEKGNEVERAFFGLDGKPVTLKAGYTRLTQRYDAAGKLLDKTYWLLNDQGEYALDRREDPNKRVLEKALYTPEKKPRYDENGAHRWTNEYDERGRIIGGAAFTPDGKPALVKNGYHRWSGKLDEQGRTVEKSYFGVDGKPCLSVFGNHRWTARFDERGKEVEGTNYGVDGKPCLHRDGIHRWTAKFDDKGNEVDRSYWGLDGKLVTHKVRGYARLETLRDAGSRATEEIPHDEQDKPLHFRVTAGKPLPEKIRQAGVEEGDEIVRLDGKEVRSRAGYSYLSSGLPAGKPVALELRREGKAVRVEIAPDLLNFPLDQKVARD